MNAYPHLKKKEKERKRIYYVFIWYAIILMRSTANYALKQSTPQRPWLLL